MNLWFRLHCDTKGDKASLNWAMPSLNWAMPSLNWENLAQLYKTFNIAIHWILNARFTLLAQFMQLRRNFNIAITLPTQPYIFVVMLVQTNRLGAWQNSVTLQLSFCNIAKNWKLAS